MHLLRLSLICACACWPLLSFRTASFQCPCEIGAEDLKGSWNQNSVRVHWTRHVFSERDLEKRKKKKGETSVDRWCEIKQKWNVSHHPCTSFDFFLSSQVPISFYVERWPCVSLLKRLIGYFNYQDMDRMTCLIFPKKVLYVFFHFLCFPFNFF